jgi:D-arginine dehydrogenase|nr:FAD-dependent oxidoreductase [Kofleriaceae bacterium]
MLASSADVVIVGGGFAGLATAWTLARRGVERVVVLEREDRLGAHASGRGAGLGRQLAEDDDTTALTVRGAAVLRGELADAWTPTGGVLSFDDPAACEVYRARAERFGVATVPLAASDALARWPALAGWRFAAALGIPSDGTIDIHRLRERFARGVDARLGARVTAIEPGRVVTERETFATRVVVEATGAWAGPLVGAAPLRAMRRHVFVVDAPAPGDAPWHWHLGAGELYVRRDPAGTLVSPCDSDHVPAQDVVPTGDADARLAARVAAIPALAAAPIARRWAGLRTFTADHRMRLGRDPERPWLVWAVGLGGHGATASAAVGERVAAAVLDALASSH